MSMSLREFLLHLFLMGAGTFCAVVFVCLVTAWVRSFLDRRHKVRCRICGFRFYVRDGNPRAECPHCGAANRKG
ncbi:hypothetical protein [Akkermansia muciniphila]|uniref:hypothetical protein n=1 Tax=Akkermansia muciniphila TaxID=239935 RepID=UPI001BFFC676|nr:hypothetical protein [Akkermansia muciniphila]MBT8777336.1 hypothetical protein [Akkermansia muciniphila]